MNEVRTAIVGIVCLAVGGLGAWFIYGGKAAELEQEIKVLREQQGILTPSVTNSPQLRSQLVGEWATTVSKSRLGRIELIFELGDDGTVRWKSVHEQEFTTIAEGTWELSGENLRFDVTVVDKRSDDLGQTKSADARVLHVGHSCLSLDVAGDRWAFHRTTT